MSWFFFVVCKFLKTTCLFQVYVWILMLVVERCGKVQMNTKWWKTMKPYLGHKLLVVLWFHQAHDFTVHWIFNFLYCRNYFDFVSCLFLNPFMSCLWMLKFIMTLVFLLFMETRKQLRMHILFYGFRIRHAFLHLKIYTWIKIQTNHFYQDKNHYNWKSMVKTIDPNLKLMGFHILKI
jgi:hypothetical protein